MPGTLKEAKSLKQALKAKKNGLLWIEITKEGCNKEIVNPEYAIKYFMAKENKK